MESLQVDSNFRGRSFGGAGVLLRRGEILREADGALSEGLGATLPTEALLEYARRAGMKTAFWFGDSADYPTGAVVDRSSRRA